MKQGLDEGWSENGGRQRSPLLLRWRGGGLCKGDGVREGVLGFVRFPQAEVYGEGEGRGGRLLA